MAKDKLNDETVYVCTYGFVAGLPQECSLKQARELGLEIDFLAAVENGNYVLPRSVSAKTAPPPTPPQIQKANLERGDEEK